MVRLRKAVLLALMFAAVATVPSLAQGAITQALQSATTPSPAAAPNDPLGRESPSNSILGFLKAAQSGDYAIATRIGSQDIAFAIEFLRLANQQILRGSPSFTY